jgi:putative glutamine amidotransferase
MQSQTERASGRPIIGVGCSLEGESAVACRLNLEYADAVVRAGGVPVIVPPGERAVDALDAVDAMLFVGGDDYDPATYGQPRHRATVLIHPRRDRSDRLLAAEALRRGLPVLGICGGLQLLNIALGGDLIQDIPDLIPGAVEHRAAKGEPPARHAVRIVPGTFLEEIVGKREASVNSFHHQAAGRLGQGLRVGASTADGVVEAIEAATKGKFVLGVQWHPEREPGDVSDVLFRALIEAARGTKGRGR